MEGLKRKGRLLITASTFPRWEGDTEPRFILDYAKVMTKYYDVTVLVPMAPGAKENEILEGVNVVRFHYFPVHQWETLCYPGAIIPRIKEKKIRALLVPFLFVSQKLTLKKICQKVDIVHAHWIIPQGIVQMGIKNVPYIVTGHGGDVTSLNFWPFSYMKRKVLEKAEHITVVSETLEKYIQNIYPNKKTSVIPMGCDTLTFSPKYRINNFFGQGEKKVILFVGRLEEIKGVTYLIEAMKEIEGAILYIVGKGSLEELLKKQADRLEDKVVFLGAKTHKELPIIYASADVFVVPSVTSRNGEKEGFGLVIIEAMASGLPVVASRSGGITSIIENEVNGLLFEERNVHQLSLSVNRILKNAGLRDELIKNGLLTTKHNDYDVVARKYSGIIEKVIDK